MSPLPTRRGDSLVVPAGTRLPKICLKCGAKKNVVRRERPYTIGGLGQSGGVAGGLVAAAMGPVIRTLDAVTAVGVVTGVAAVLGTGAWLWERSLPKHQLGLPLCETCNAAWTEGEATRTRWLVVLFAAFALGGVGYALSSVPLMFVGGLAVVLAIGLIAAARLPTLFVSSTTVTPTEVHLRVAPEIADVVVARAAKRAERATTNAEDEENEGA